MKTYTILRRSAFKTPQDLQVAGERSVRIANDEMSDRLRWIRSYILREADGALGTVCIYQATGVETIREHGERAGLPVDDVTEVGDTVVMEPDPVPA